jgi:hypothetical protein
MKHALAMLLLWLAMRPAFAEESAASAFLARLAGNWRGTGEVNQRAADMRMTWERVLDGQFLRLAMDNRMTGAEGSSVEQDSMTIQWGTDAIERGRSH